MRQSPMALRQRVAIQSRRCRFCGEQIHKGDPVWYSSGTGQVCQREECCQKAIEQYQQRLVAQRNANLPMEPVPAQEWVLNEVRAERARQDRTWGEQNHGPEVWLMILGEEVGEANRHALEAWATPTEHPGARRSSLQHYRAELIQVAAVAVAMVESLDRNELKGPDL